jgi:hypothetical protein
MRCQKHSVPANENDRNIFLFGFLIQNDFCLVARLLDIVVSVRRIQLNIVCNSIIMIFFVFFFRATCCYCRCPPVNVSVLFFFFNFNFFCVSKHLFLTRIGTFKLIEINSIQFDCQFLSTIHTIFYNSRFTHLFLFVFLFAFLCSANFLLCLPTFLPFPKKSSPKSMFSHSNHRYYN